MTRHDRHYQVFDMTWLDDLELWSSQTDGCTALASPDDRNRFRLAMPSDVHVPCIEDIRDEDSLALGTDSTTSVLCHVMLDNHRENCAFLYCFPSLISLHIPEYFFVTGNLDCDAQRMQLTRAAASAICRFFGIFWENASFGGRTVPIRDEEMFWETYVRDLYRRFEHSLLET